MDEMSKLREWRADAPSPDRARLAPGRARLLDAAAAGKRRRRPAVHDWRMAVSAVAACVTLLALLTTVLGGGLLGGPEDGEGGTDAAGDREKAAAEVQVDERAHEVLELAAVAAEEQPDPKPQEGDWVYVRTARVSEAVNSDDPRIEESWYSYADARDADREHYDDRTPQERYELLATLPGEDPEDVQRAARAFYPDENMLPGVTEPEPGEEAEEAVQLNFRVLRMLLEATPTQPDGQAAVYRSLATLPGVRVLADTVEDAAGREALAVTLPWRPGFDLKMSGGVQGVDWRPEVLIDPVTYDFLGSRDVQRSERQGTASWVGGTLPGSIAFLDTALVGKRGERP
ncbi:CU044_5270 family protein [Streptomyces sp. MAR4 CNY-716]